MQVLFPVLTIFLLMLMGYTSVRSKLIDFSVISGISSVVLYFAQPCLILDKMQQDVTPELLIELGWMFVCTCIIMVISGLIAWLIYRKQPHNMRAVLTNLVMASNCGFMGYPLIEAAFGADAIIYAVLYASAFQVVCWTLGAFFYRGKEAVSIRNILLNPTILAVVFGSVFLVTGWRLPNFINEAVRYMGSITTPMAMFVIGARLLGVRRSDLTNLPMLSACALRLLVVPLAVLAVLSLTSLSATVKGVLFLCSAMPCATLCAMQSDVFDCEKMFASRGVAVSTAISLVTIPVLMMVM